MPDAAERATSAQEGKRRESDSGVLTDAGEDAVDSERLELVRVRRGRVVAVAGDERRDQAGDVGSRLHDGKGNVSVSASNSTPWAQRRDVPSRYQRCCWWPAGHRTGASG